MVGKATTGSTEYSSSALGRLFHAVESKRVQPIAKLRWTQHKGDFESHSGANWISATPQSDPDIYHMLRLPGRCQI